MQNILSQPITERAFKALDLILEMGLISSYEEFCWIYGFPVKRMNLIRQDPRREVQLFFLRVLVDDFGVNARWLLTGTGQIIDPAGRSAKYYLQYVKNLN